MIEVNKDIELIQVLLYLTKMQEKTFQQITNRNYINSIETFFKGHETHQAVLLTKDLIENHSFVHITPIIFILYLKEILADNYIDIQNLVLERNISYEKLKSWANAVNHFIVEASFKTFFKEQYNYYKETIVMIESWDYDIEIQRIKKYFRSRDSPFKLIICPLNGNYGFVLDKPKKNSFYVVRCLPFYDDDGNITWDNNLFAKGIAHEFAHCYVNPVVEANKDLLKSYKPFFEKHEKMLESYNLPYAIINEYWVRAFAIRFMEIYKDYFQTFNIQEEYTRQRKYFIYIDRFVLALKRYEITNETFNDFYLDNISNILSY